VLVWDLRRSYSLLKEPRPFLRLSADLPESTAFTCAAVCPQSKSLYAQCTDNAIYKFNINVYAEKPGSRSTGYLCSSSIPDNHISDSSKVLTHQSLLVSVFYGHNAGRGEGAYFIKMDVSPSGSFWRSIAQGKIRGRLDMNPPMDTC